MSYRIVLVMKKSFKDSDSFDGLVSYAREFERKTYSIVDGKYGVRYFEHFSKDSSEVCINAQDYFDVQFFPNLIRVRCPLQWSTFFDWDNQRYSLREEFQKMIDLIQPEECWIGTDYATDQIFSLEAGLSRWLDDVQKEYGHIDEFIFDSVYEDLRNHMRLKDLYHVKNNTL